MILSMKYTIKDSVVDCKEALSKSEAKQKEHDERQRKLFIGGLPKNLKDEVLKDYFSSFGKVQKAYVVKDYKTGNTRGFGFVIFADAESYNRALYFPSTHTIQDKDIHVRETHSRKEEKEKGKTEKVAKTHVGEKLYAPQPAHNVYGHGKPVLVNYAHPPPYQASSTSSFRPGYVAYVPPPPVYYMYPEGYIPYAPNGAPGPAFMPPRPVPVQLAPSSQYAYPPGEEVYYMAAPAPPTNMHISYQPVYRLEGGQAYYQAVSSPQIDTRYYNPRVHQQMYIDREQRLKNEHLNRPNSHMNIKKHKKPANLGVAYSEKNIQGSPKMNLPKTGSKFGLKTGLSQKSKPEERVSISVQKQSNFAQSDKGAKPNNLENLEEEPEEEEEMKRVCL